MNNRKIIGVFAILVMLVCSTALFANTYESQNSYAGKLYVRAMPEYMGNYTTFRGSITNLGNQPVSFVRIKVIVESKYSEGYIVDTVTTYAVDDVPLMPNERRTWTAMTYDTNGSLTTRKYSFEVVSYKL